MLTISDLVLATGALGTAAFGIVEASKWIPAVGEFGLRQGLKRLGPLMHTLRVAYGPDYLPLLRGQYRGDQKDLVRTLRQGMRVGLTRENAGEIAQYLGALDAERFVAAAVAAQSGNELTAEQRNLIGRYELAADARVDAAMAVAQANYGGMARSLASVVSLGIAIIAAQTLEPKPDFVTAVLIGVAAVPLAPIAKDLAAGLAAASKALRARV